MRPLALKWRLSILVAAAMAVAMTVICIIAYKEIRELAWRQADQALLSAGRVIGVVLEDQAGAEDRQAKVRAILSATAKGPAATARVWRDGAGQEIAVGRADVQRAVDQRILGLVRPNEGRSTAFDVASPQGNYRAVWMRAPGRDGPLNIVVAHSTRSISGELRELILKDLLVTALAVVAVVATASIAIVVLGLRPIRRTANRLLGVTASNLGQVNLPSGEVPAELSPFVESVTDMLVRLDLAIRRQKKFIAEASHELRTPIAVAKTTLELSLAGERSAQEYRQALLATAEDVGRLEHLVDELLTLARLDEAGELVNPQVVDLGDLLADLAEALSPRVSQSGGKLACNLHPAQVWGNPGQLERLFTNLMENAVRYGPEGGTTEVGMELQGQEVVVMVRDPGGRISANDLPRLFDRFYRADGSRSHSTGGAGLGLAIAKEIVLRHGGDISITSRPDEGTCASVRLPIWRRPRG